MIVWEMKDSEARVLSEELNLHVPTTGMRVSSGETCKCGFWEGRSLRRNRGSDGLEVHRAEIAVSMALDRILVDCHALPDLRQNVEKAADE